MHQNLMHHSTESVLKQHRFIHGNNNEDGQVRVGSLVPNPINTINKKSRNLL